MGDLRAQERTTIGADLLEGHKETELGPLPEDWEAINFSAAVAKGRFRIGKVKQQQYKPTGAYPVVDQGQKLIAGYWDNEEDAYDGKLPVVVFGDHTRVFKLVDFPFVAGADGLKVIVPNRDLFDPQFLYYALLNVDIPSRGYNRHFPLLKEKSLPRPPLSEQQALAHVLRAVQQAKEATERVIEATRELKRSLMNHLFTYGPVPVDEADQVPLKETEIGPLPEYWEATQLREVFKLSSGNTRPGTIKPQPQSEYLFPVYGGNGVMGFATEYLVENSTIVVGRVGEYCGSVHIAPPRSWISDNALFVKEWRQNIDTVYLAAALKLLDLNRFKKKSGQPLITQSIVYDQRIPLPPLSEQDQISSILASIDRKIESEEKRSKTLRVLFNTLLHNLMTAKVRVQDLDLSTVEEMA